MANCTTTKEIAERMLFVWRHDGRNFYGYFYIFAQILNTCNSLGQLVLLNFHLNYEYLLFGWNFFSGETIQIFPFYIKCSYNMFDESRNIVSYEPICSLPSMYLYKAIFLAIWFILTFMIFTNSIDFFTSLLTLCFRCARSYLLYSPNNTRYKYASLLGNCLCFDDFVFIINIQRNTPSYLFHEFIQVLHTEENNKNNKAVKSA